MGGSRTILFADDDVRLATACKHALELRGWDVVVALDGEQALLAASWVEPEAVVVEAGLQGKSAGQLCAALRRDARTARTPVIVISKEGSARAIEAAFRCGAADYLTEPFDVYELDIALRRALQERSEAEAYEVEGAIEDSGGDGDVTRPGGLERRERQPAA